MKFIHTSDWHIGRQFHNVSLLEDQAHVLAQLIEYIEQEAVDALVIAGDIYDRSVPPATAVELLDQVLNRICNELDVPVILIPGNHDSAERLRFGARQLRQSGLFIVGELGQVAEPVKLTGDGVEVHFYGIPYNDPEAVRNNFGVEVSNHDEAHTFLVQQIVENNGIGTDNSGAPVNVLISHCFVDGAKESDSERPLSIGGADRVSYEPLCPFDYVALGHLHSPQYRGERHIRYSGSLLKYSFSEQNQKKGVTLVQLDGNGVLDQLHLPLKPLRDMRVLEGELTTLVEQGKTDPQSDDYLLVRLTDRQAILDPMGKLREVYPNVLHLEKPGMLAASEQPLKREKLKRGELEMFSDFFLQVSGQPLSEAQSEALRDTLASLHKEPSDGGNV